MKRISRTGLIVAILPLAFGVATLLVGHHFMRTAERSIDWPSVQGVVVESAVRNVETDPPGAGRKSVGYYPEWWYQYEVSGEHYRSNVIAIGEASKGYNKEDAAYAVAEERFPVGTKVTVFYDPDDPASATTLHGQASADVWIILAVGFGLVAIALLLPFVLPEMTAER